ncbi:MAG TPA: antitoxin [Trueperaceae bacterium]|nr:antitoxin [Trueperaceae bacterium]
MAQRQKLSVSVSSSLVRFLERYQRDHGLKTKSSVVERALEVLRERDLERAYAEAAELDHDAGDTADWDVTAGDGLSHEEWRDTR